VELWNETDGLGLRRMVAQSGRKRRYSYDAGLTWAAIPLIARRTATGARIDSTARKILQEKQQARTT